MEIPVRVELTMSSFADCRLTTWLRDHKMVGKTGFEPATFCSQSRRSSQSELHSDKPNVIVLGRMRSKPRHNFQLCFLCKPCENTSLCPTSRDSLGLTILQATFINIYYLTIKIYFGNKKPSIS